MIRGGDSSSSKFIGIQYNACDANLYNPTVESTVAVAVAVVVAYRDIFVKPVQLKAKYREVLNTYKY